MRISSVTMFEQSVSSMNRQQGEFLNVSQQIASGRRVVNPSDDPQAASRAVGVDQAKAVTQQYADSRVSARNSLSQTESILNSVSDAVTSAKTLMVQASSDTLSDVDRQSVASELRGIYETVIGQANATDGNGRHLFGGYQDSSEPFVRTAGGIDYAGDSNTREQRIDSSRLMKVTENGESIFQSVPSGAGYVAEADGGNAGSLTFSGPQVIDNDDPDYGEAFRVTFTSDTEYDVEKKNAAGGWDMLTSGSAYDGESGTVSVGGLRLDLKGEAVSGDTIEFAPADEMNTDLFRTFEKALAVLENEAGAPATPQRDAERTNTLKTVMREFDNSLDNVLTTRASVGARLNELDVVDSVGGNRMLNYEQTLSDLVDLDYAEAISEYSLRQVGLQASQKTFADMKGMSLFNYL
ncbi:flagellar hook-associated protein FlgL [Halomonas daqiaonensis]|uniref:Flagellar hook-associated protein 3 FlgL n=1 Tax=Halomonas daqiaonensis TaxID=650850 RepID=A0A1H7SNY6_9GAMM|nr:flagellar hook-associated protein FlgL [Halomonas daqiaonensis]SEL74361.1 flagellar hook-associated protein 3 FlgL [Halomonas daqiaonensis]